MTTSLSNLNAMQPKRKIAEDWQSTTKFIDYKFQQAIPNLVDAPRQRPPERVHTKPASLKRALEDLTRK